MEGLTGAVPVVLAAADGTAGGVLCLLICGGLFVWAVVRWGNNHHARWLAQQKQGTSSVMSAGAAASAVEETGRSSLLPSSTASAALAVVRSTHRSAWVPAGQAVRVGDYTLPGGMVYVGERLDAVRVSGVEPALINPRLKVGARPNRTGDGMGYWPSYSSISPASRAGYLEWLASGRREPSLYIGYVFLFFYGLERRALVEARDPTEGREERRLIEAEVAELLRVYGGTSNSFRRYASAFLDVLRVVRADGEALLRESPQFDLRAAGSASFDVRAALGAAAAKGLPVPADWALAWAVEAGETRLRTPATRCPEEFRALFRTRYARQFGTGIVPRANRTRLDATYQPASASFGGAVRVSSLDLPTASEASLRPLHALVEECCGELEGYSRYVGKNPEGRQSLAALALLPADLAHSHGNEDVRALRDTLATALAGKALVTLPAATLLEHWPTAEARKVSKSEAVTLAATLEKLGYGLEPDARFGGAVLASDGQATLFRLPPDSPSAPTTAYLTALATLHLAAMVAAADGVVTSEEIRRLEAVLEGAFGLSHPERVRLGAHLAWLLLRPPGAAGLKKKVEALSASAKAALGNVLVEITVADGRVESGELKALTKLYPLLGLDPAAVYARVHASAAARPEPAQAPVSVRLAGEPGRGFALPPPPAEATPLAKNAALAPLDMRSVQAKLAETAAVSTLLGNIFQEAEAPAPSAPPLPAGADSLAGLDPSHSALVRALVAQSEWPRSEVERLAASLGLLTDGALDVINDAAFDACGGPLIEGEDVLNISAEAAKEMMA